MERIALLVIVLAVCSLGAGLTLPDVWQPLTFPKPHLLIYHEEMVSRDNPAAAAGELARTITKPAAIGSCGLVLLIPGSCPHDQNETIIGHKPSEVIANGLARPGVATQRYADHGSRF